MKKNLSIIVVLILLLSLFVSCTLHDNSTTSVAELGVAPEKPLAIHTDKQYTYLQRALSSNASAYANGKKELSKPVDLRLKWDIKSSDCTVKISENSDMSNAVTYKTDKNDIYLNNFKIAASYYWTVTSNGVESEVNEFMTDGACPRNLSVDGVTNVRDLGGWETGSGKRTKQGLIYRSGRLNESNAKTPNIEITESGKKVMLETLGIRCEIDLRKSDDGEIGGIDSSPLGDSVNYYNCPMEWDGNMWLDNRAQIIYMFSLLANAENYPLVFHCNIGTDRTGMMAFLSNALLGVSEDDLLKDYMFSNLGKIGGTRHKTGVTDSPYYKAVAEANGSSLSEKTYNALVALGVRSEHIDFVISTLKGE